MIILGHPEPPRASEFLQPAPARRSAVPQWYHSLREKARWHDENGRSPELCEAPQAQPHEFLSEGVVEAAANTQQLPNPAEALDFITDEEDV
jgi:hypothetical protein